MGNKQIKLKILIIGSIPAKILSLIKSYCGNTGKCKSFKKFGIETYTLPVDDDTNQTFIVPYVSNSLSNVNKIKDFKEINGVVIVFLKSDYESYIGIPQKMMELANYFSLNNLSLAFLGIKGGTEEVSTEEAFALSYGYSANYYEYKEGDKDTLDGMFDHLVDDILRDKK